MLIDKKFSVIGGGTGTFSVLSGLKKYTDNITAIVTMADSGGSAKKERDEWGLLPSSDIRKSLLALTDISKEDLLLLRQLFQYRYREGKGLVGMSFGNLFLVTLTKLLGSQKKAIEKAGEILKIKGKVLPVTLDKVDLVAVYEDGTKIIGEHRIDEPSHNGSVPIQLLTTKPKAKVNPDAQSALVESDVIIIGPGGFYTTIIANLVIDGIVEAIINSKAKKILILNLMTEYGQTYGFTASKFLQELNKYLPIRYLDYVLINKTPIPENILLKYERAHASPVINDLSCQLPIKIVEGDFLSPKIIKREKGDILKRSLIRHDPDKLTRMCLKILHLI